MLIRSQNLFLYGVKVDWISLVSEWALLERRIINPEIWNGFNLQLFCFMPELKGFMVGQLL